MNADGTGQIQLTDNTVADLTCSWSPDGLKIVFHRQPAREGGGYRRSTFHVCISIRSEKLLMYVGSMIRMLALGFLFVLCFNIQVFAKKYTLLVVLTHGDDLASIAPLPAKYAAERHAVYYAIFTGTQVAQEAGSKEREETLCASREIGIKETFVLSGPDGQGHETVAAIAKRMIELINLTKPDVIITWGPDGLTGHPRHILVSTVVTRVFQQQALLEHKPRKLYYIAYPESRFPDKRVPFGGIYAQVPFGTVSDNFITTTVDARRYLGRSRKAIACHTIPDTKRPNLPKSEITFEQEWNHRTGTALEGKVFLRLVIPAARGRETDIFKGL